MLKIIFDELVLIFIEWHSDSCNWRIKLDRVEDALWEDASYLLKYTILS